MKTIFVLLTLCAAFGAEQNSPVKVTKVATPEKALQFEVVVPAKLDDVWAAFTTNAGLKTWLWSDVTVELRPGGEWTVHFPGGSTGGGTITGFTPQRQLILRALAPEKFPEVRSQRTTATFDFQPMGSETRVTLTQTGWKQGKEWDDAYDYLAQGNAQLLAALHYRFVKGPIDWNQIAKGK